MLLLNFFLRFTRSDNLKSPYFLIKLNIHLIDINSIDLCTLISQVRQKSMFVCW